MFVIFNDICSNNNLLSNKSIYQLFNKGSYLGTILPVPRSSSPSTSVPLTYSWTLPIDHHSNNINSTNTNISNTIPMLYFIPTIFNLFYMDISYLFQQYKYDNYQYSYNQIFALYIQGFVYQVHAHFSAPTIKSITTYDSYTASISIATPHLVLAVAPTEDITAPAPTIRTTDYGIYVAIPGSSLNNATPPFLYHAPQTPFVLTAPAILYE